MSTMIDLDRFYWKYGGRFDFWIRNLAFVKRFIKENHLKPIRKVHLAADMPLQELPLQEMPLQAAPMEDVEATPSPAAPSPKMGRTWEEFMEMRIGIRGGKRIPHLHFRNDIYLLTQEQWNRFTGEVIRDYEHKLANVKAVGFQDLMDLSEAIEALPMMEKMRVERPMEEMAIAD